MKKLIAILLVLACCCSAFACTAADKYADLKVDAAGIGSNLLANCNFEYTPEALDDPEFSASVLDLDLADLGTANGAPELFFATNSSSPENIVVVGAKDAATAKRISENQMKDWIRRNREGYETYGAEQVPKIDSAVNFVAGRYVFVIISNDNPAAKTFLTGLLDTALKING